MLLSSVFLVGQTIVSEVLYMNHVIDIRMYDVVSIATNTYFLLTIYSHSFYWLLYAVLSYMRSMIFSVFISFNLMR